VATCVFRLFNISTWPQSRSWRAKDFRHRRYAAERNKQGCNLREKCSLASHRVSQIYQSSLKPEAVDLEPIIPAFGPFFFLFFPNEIPSAPFALPRQNS
jgi:hypothetical protein